MASTHQASNETPNDQLSRQKRAVSYDSYDMSIRQLVDMVESKVIDIAPDYQRHFVWEEPRESELIESILLGIPVPSLFMATNSDATWEVIDGVQRLSTILHFCGGQDLIKKVRRNAPLELSGLQKLNSFNGFTFDKLPQSLQLQLLTRPLRITTLNDKSDSSVRYDLFERLNTGGVKLHPQEIRNCVFRGPFTDSIRRLARSKTFRKVVRLPANEVQDATYEECVLRFFAFRDSYKSFNHSVKDFLNEHTEKYQYSSLSGSPADLFQETMAEIDGHLPKGIIRNNRGTTPINLYEAIVVGVSLALSSSKKPRLERLPAIISSEELTKLTTGATNSRTRVRGRIEYVASKLIS